MHFQLHFFELNELSGTAHNDKNITDLVYLPITVDLEFNTWFRKKWSGVFRALCQTTLSLQSVTRISFGTCCSWRRSSEITVTDGQSG